MKENIFKLLESKMINIAPKKQRNFSSGIIQLYKCAKLLQQYIYYN